VKKELKKSAKQLSKEERGTALATIIVESTAIVVRCLLYNLDSFTHRTVSVNKILHSNDQGLCRLRSLLTYDLMLVPF